MDIVSVKKKKKKKSTFLFLFFKDKVIAGQYLVTQIMTVSVQKPVYKKE